MNVELNNKEVGAVLVAIQQSLLVARAQKLEDESSKEINSRVVSNLASASNKILAAAQSEDQGAN